MSSILVKKNTKIVKSKTEKQPVQYFILKAVSIGKRVKIEDIIEQIEQTISKKDTEERKVKPAYTIQRTIKKLENDGCLIIEIEEKAEYIQLTKDGLQKLQDQMFISKDSVIPISNWDGFYRIVILTTKNKDVREKLRYALKRAQFEHIAPGVFISKLDMEHIILGLKAVCGDGFISFKSQQI